jgi:hypothetical protein
MVLKAFLQLAEKRCHDIQHNGSHVMSSVIHAECRTISLYAECHYAECRYAACRGAKKNSFVFPPNFLSNIDKIKWLSERANLHVSMTVAFGLAFFRSVRLL